MKIAAMMSGGVDSSVAAAMLKQDGHDVTGIFVDAYNEPGCRTDQDKADALKIAMKLEIPFRVVDMRARYRKLVVDYFFWSYKEGKTPNPDIVCNRDVKFGLMLEYADAHGFEKIATGHYAELVERAEASEHVLIRRPIDLNKDQTYFLAQVEPAKLKKVLFPLAEYSKREVREMADKYGFTNYLKPDSMGVCMMGELRVAELLEQKLGLDPGPVIYHSQVVGRHQGVWYQTIGQRVGARIKLDHTALVGAKLDPAQLPPLYVIRKERVNNTIYIGTRGEAMTETFALDRFGAYIEKAKLMALVREKLVTVRIRNLGELVQVKELVIGESGRVQLKLNEPIFAAAEGQVAVIYAKLDRSRELVVANGEIVYI